MNHKEALGLLEAKVAVVRLKHGIVRKWLAKQVLPPHVRTQQENELDFLENQALVDLHLQFWEDMKANHPSIASRVKRWVSDRVTEFRARRDIINHITGHDTKLVDSCHTETGYADRR